MPYYIEYCCVSHKGHRRGTNQDNFICNGAYMGADNVPSLPLSGTVKDADNTLFGVFDGLGGESFGEVASFIAARCAAEHAASPDSEDLLKLCRSANGEICRWAEKNGGVRCGTTAALLEFSKGTIRLCNVGDSKIFLFSGGKLEQISEDHVSPAPFGMKARLDRYLGIPEGELLLVPFFAEGAYSSNDLFLICSDGLTDMVESSRIGDILRKSKTPSAAQKLLDAALEAGGTDNVTVIVCRIKKRLL